MVLLQVLWLNGQRVGRLDGTVVVHDGPKVVQLPSGFFTERGIFPVGPIAAGLLPQSGKDATEVEANGRDSNVETDQGNVGDIQKPAGLKIPKEVSSCSCVRSQCRSSLVAPPSFITHRWSQF